MPGKLTPLLFTVPPTKRVPNKCLPARDGVVTTTPVIIPVVPALTDCFAHCCRFLKSMFANPVFPLQMVPKELSRKLWSFQKQGLDGLLSDWYG